MEKDRFCLLEKKEIPKQARLSAVRFGMTEAIFYLLKTNLLRFQVEKIKKCKAIPNRAIKIPLKYIKDK